MTYEPDCTLPSDLLEQISTQGFDFLPELIRVLVNAAMRVERQKHLAVEPCERSANRQGHANGFKPVWGRSLLPSRKCVRVVSTPTPWKRGCVVNGR